ncbi:death ligand signal enhancer isoform X1 [Lissotriton helveticus]
MWRLPNLVGRALHRFHSANVSSSLHAAPHTEVDVLNSSGLLPAGSSSSIKSFHSNSENGQNGGGRGREKTFRPFCRQLPQYCALDAIGWGAVAAAFLHLSKQITSPDSTPNPATKERSFWPACLDGLVASVLRYQGHSPKWYILPNETRRIHLGEHQSETPDRSYDVSSGPPSPGRSANTESQDSDPYPSEEEGLDFTSRSTSNSWSESEDTGSRQPCEGESRLGVSLEDAASQLQETSLNSTSVVLNIIGISSVRENGDYSTAVTCFQAAASRGYSKAQYNAGVCYEHGYGVCKDLEKAAVYYHLAAINGHRMAQYRYARYLLHHKVGVEAEERQQALKMLEQAAEAGLKEAQAYLGVFYTKDSRMDPQKAVQYLRKAAESGDAQSRFHLGVCYESGFGVDLNVPEAIKHYEKAALEGHRSARERLSSIQQKQMEDLLHRHPHHMKTINSCPRLSSMDGIPAESPRSGVPGSTLHLSPTFHAASSAIHLPHSRSTGSLNILADQPLGFTDVIGSPVSLGVLSLSSMRAIGVG